MFLLMVEDQVSHPYKATGRKVVLYILVLGFLDRRLEDKSLRTKCQQAFPEFKRILRE